LTSPEGARNITAKEVTDLTDFPEFIRGLPQLDLPFDGASGHVLQGESQQVAFIHFDHEAEVPEHSHAAQWEFVVDGEVELRMDGKKTRYRAGDRFYLPAGAEHGATVGAGYRAVIFFDQPDRYKTKP